MKQERLHRLLGGGIEFGERAEDAVVREMRKETGSGAHASRILGVLESFFTFEGKSGHEIAYVFEVEVQVEVEVELEDASLYQRDWFEVIEVIHGEEVRVPALWVDPSSVDAPLYPDGQVELLARP